MNKGPLMRTPTLHMAQANTCTHSLGNNKFMREALTFFVSE